MGEVTIKDVEAKNKSVNEEIKVGNSRGRFRAFTGAREIRILFVVICVAIIMYLLSPTFLTRSNITAVAIGFATDAIIAIAMTIVLIGGGFDLSVGSVLAFGGVIVALLLNKGMAIFPAILVTLIAGALIGTISGLVITKLRVNALITTLGMMSIISSATLVVSGGYPLSNLPKEFLFLGQGFIGGIPVAVVIMAVLVLAGDFLLRRTRLLRLVYYVGSNPGAAALSGISVDRVIIATYIVSGLTAAFAGVIATSRLSAAFPMAGVGTEMRVISACVIGGCSLSGGEGTVIGSLLGVLLMALINNALVLLNVSIYWQGIVSGLILIAAVAFDMLSKKKRTA
ncbi:Ribose import permease protein RbsC [Neomoorella glycerini]|uniref:Ribose import permease protein RbsC n=1 Tax=Neomoorella glycerini TaxID=55779 RepID=A0A6I5ZS18_9FIRM|nr:ABC transporter permease [Moorella glycerini]QGP92538.1 Ribose import permease protein RbsC [Moorella glycerini]